MAYRDEDVAELIAAADEVLGALDIFEMAEALEEINRLHAALDRLRPAQPES